MQDTSAIRVLVVKFFFPFLWYNKNHDRGYLRHYIIPRLILAARRSKSMELPLKWEFPGGKVETGETAESCLLRELKEELNIEVEIIQRLNPSEYSYDFGTIKLIPFLVNYLSGEIKLLEYKAFRWLKRNELRGLDWTEADVAVVEEFLKFTC